MLFLLLIFFLQKDKKYKNFYTKHKLIIVFLWKLSRWSFLHYRICILGEHFQTCQIHQLPDRTQKLKIGPPSLVFYSSVFLLSTNHKFNALIIYYTTTINYINNIYFSKWQKNCSIQFWWSNINEKFWIFVEITRMTVFPSFIQSLCRIIGNSCTSCNSWRYKSITRKPSWFHGTVQSKSVGVRWGSRLYNVIHDTIFDLRCRFVHHCAFSQ